MNFITLTDYLIFSTVLFGIGVAGVFINIKNIIVTLMSIELILLAVSTNFIAFSKYSNNVSGQIFVVFILTVAALEIAIGLTLLMLLFKNKNTISVG